MPIYAFIADDGSRLDEHFEVAKRPLEIIRGGRRYLRRRVPDRVGTVVGTPAPSMSDCLRAGYRKLEEQGKLRDQKGYLPLNQVRAALAQPD